MNQAITLKKLLTGMGSKCSEHYLVLSQRWIMFFFSFCPSVEIRSLKKRMGNDFDVRNFIVFDEIWHGFKPSLQDFQSVHSWHKCANVVCWTDLLVLFAYKFSSADRGETRQEFLMTHPAVRSCSCQYHQKTVAVDGVDTWFQTECFISFILCWEVWLV